MRSGMERSVSIQSPNWHGSIAVKVVATGDADARSKGKRVSLNQAVAYRAAD